MRGEILSLVNIKIIVVLGVILYSLVEYQDHSSLVCDAV
jgi:hypothetical protein